MENIQSKLADLPQWQKIGLAALMAFLVVFSMFAPSKSYAATLTKPSGYDSTKSYVYFKVGTYYYFFQYDKSQNFFYHNASFDSSTDIHYGIGGSSGSVTFWTSSDGSTWDGGHPSGVPSNNMIYGNKADGNGTGILGSNVDVYTDINKSGVFFSAPTPPTPPAPPAKLAQVTDLPQAILGPLTTGGLLGVGLTILAIMLGVSLVPRLIHLFNR